MGRHLIRYAIVFAGIYVAGYLLFRMLQQQVEAEDGATDVFFPEGTQALYYLWRPLIYLDGTLTGMSTIVIYNRITIQEE